MWQLEGMFKDECVGQFGCCRLSKWRRLLRAEIRELGKSKLWGTREGSEVHYHELWGLFLFWWEKGEGCGGESWRI